MRLSSAHVHSFRLCPHQFLNSCKSVLQTSGSPGSGLTDGSTGSIPHEAVSVVGQQLRSLSLLASSLHKRGYTQMLLDPVNSETSSVVDSSGTFGVDSVDTRIMTKALSLVWSTV